MHNFRELKIWQRSMDIVVDVYDKTKTFPKEETYGITQQIRRSGVSIPSNISEGAGRNTDSQFKHFLEISMGSCNELQTQIELSRRIGYLSNEEANKILDEALQIYRVILAYYNSL
jgi:four helix bundle protein